jgi:hypothetical protein
VFRINVFHHLYATKLHGVITEKCSVLSLENRPNSNPYRLFPQEIPLPVSYFCVSIGFVFGNFLEDFYSSSAVDDHECRGFLHINATVSDSLVGKPLEGRTVKLSSFNHVSVLTSVFTFVNTWFKLNCDSLRKTLTSCSLHFE